MWRLQRVRMADSSCIVFVHRASAAAPPSTIHHLLGIHKQWLALIVPPQLDGLVVGAAYQQRLLLLPSSRIHDATVARKLLQHVPSVYVPDIHQPILHEASLLAGHISQGDGCVVALALAFGTSEPPTTNFSRGPNAARTKFLAVF